MNKKDLFFTPLVSALKAITREGNVIEDNSRRLFSNDKIFLGIKKKELLNDSEVFYQAILNRILKQNTKQTEAYFADQAMQFEKISKYL